MNKSILLGVGIGVVIAVAAGAVASYSGKHTEQQPSALLAPAATPKALPDAREVREPITSEAPAAARAAADSTKSHSIVRMVASRAPRPSVDESSAPSFARVLSSTAVVETQRVAREVCRDEQVTRQKPVKDEKRIAGAALGAIIGGVLGNQVGDGNGQKVATAAGAIAGGVAGSKIQKRVQEGNTETVTEKRCTTVYDIKEKTLGYDVKYRLGDETKTVRMTADPGVNAQLPLKNGRVVALAHSGS